MAVVGSAKEQWEHRAARFNGGIWTYTRAFMVNTDDKTDREDVVSTATGLPAYAEAHPGPVDDAAYANEITYSMTDRGDTPTAWLVVVNYSSERDLDSDPANDEVLVSWTSEIYQEAIFEDADGDAILNSAGDYFIDPSPTREANHLIAKIKANVTAIPAWVVDMENSVNNSQITIGGLIIAIGKARLQRIEIGSRERRGATTFYPLSFEVHIRDGGWLLEPLDAGFRERNASGDLIQIVNPEDNTEVTTPVPLDGAGAAMDNPTPATAVFGSFTIYPTADLTTLPGIS